MGHPGPKFQKSTKLSNKGPHELLNPPKCAEFRCEQLWFSPQKLTFQFFDTFSEKKNSRINILGEEQNKILEKKIFLQIIDFSWRSHLQYLEQLRQVVGLRSYGQKDPLAEFRKEAFELFENLLFKIKIETI